MQASERCQICGPWWLLIAGVHLRKREHQWRHYFFLLESTSTQPLQEKCQLRVKCVEMLGKLLNIVSTRRAPIVRKAEILTFPTALIRAKYSNIH